MRRSSRQTSQPDSYSHRSDSPLTDEDPPPPRSNPPSTPASTSFKGKKPSGGGSKVKQESTGEGEKESKRKRSTSTSTAGTSAGPAAAAAGPEPAGKGAQAALARSGLQVSRDLCETCKDVLVGSHVVVPCRHLLCFDCLFSHLLQIISSPPASNAIVCPYPDCGQTVAGFGMWPAKDQEVRVRVLNLSTSTYAHRSREIRQAMFDRKPSVESFLKAIPAFSCLSYGTIEEGTSAPASEETIHPRTSSSSSSSSNQPLQQQQPPSSTPQRSSLPAVPSHQLRTPSQQQLPSSTYPTPQTESRVAQGQGGYASEQGQVQPPPQPRRMGSSYGEQQQPSREAGGSERLWIGDLVIPAHGGGQVLVPSEGWTLGSQPPIPPGLLSHPISLRNFVFVNRIGPIRPTTQVLHFRPTSDTNATVRSVTEPQLDAMRRHDSLLNQLCATIVAKGALGIVVPGLQENGNPHVIFDALAFGQEQRLGLIAIVNPKALEIIARTTGVARAPVQRNPPSQLASPQQQIHDYARRQQQAQMQQQYPSHFPPPIPNPPMQYRPPPLSRVTSDPQHQQQYQPHLSVSPQLATYHSQPPTPQFRTNSKISLPPIPPSSIPPHLQSIESTSSQEFLNFPSASPEPSLSRPTMESASDLNTEASYYGGDGASMMMREGDEDLGGGGVEGGGEGRVEDSGGGGEFEVGGEGMSSMDLAAGAEGGDVGSGTSGGRGAAWRGSIQVTMSGDQESTTSVDSAQANVQLRADIHPRFDPLLLPPNLDFFASSSFEGQNLPIVGRIDISIPNSTQHMQIVRCCDSAADYQLALLFQMTANDHSAPPPSHQKFVLRLKVERRPFDGGGVGEGLVADLHMVE